MKYNQLASGAVIQRTVAALQGRGYEVTVAKNGRGALELIMKIIPEGVSVMNGSSVTLEQIGYLGYLAKGEHKWVDWHAKINAEGDKEKRAKLRRESVSVDYYLGSVHALCETGEFVVASNTGSQLSHIVNTSPNLIFVVSAKKIVPTLDMAMKRLREHVVPLEDKHMMDLYEAHTAPNKIVIFNGEAAMMGRKIRFILVEEDLGF